MKKEKAEDIAKQYAGEMLVNFPPAARRILETIVSDAWIAGYLYGFLVAQPDDNRGKAMRERRKGKRT